MRTFTLCLLLSGLFSLTAQPNPGDFPTEILWERPDAQTGAIVPFQRKVFQYIQNNLPVYEGRFLYKSDSLNPIWTPKEETWTSYHPNGVPSYRFLIEYGNNSRRHSEQTFDANGNMLLQEESFYNHDTDTLLGANRNVHSYIDGKLNYIMFSSLNLQQGIYENHTMHTYGFDSQGRESEVLISKADQGNGAFTPYSWTLHEYEINQDSTIMSESYLWNADTNWWEDQYLTIIKRYDSQGRLILDEFGHIERVVYRKQWLWSADNSYRQGLYDAIYPDDPAGVPIYRSEATYEDGLEISFTFLTEWDSTAGIFRRQTCRQSTYNAEGRIKDQVNGFGPCPPQFSPKTTYFTYTSYCDGKLHQSTINQDSVNGPLSQRITYSYASSAPCPTDLANASLHIFPNPVSSVAGYLGIESEWLADPGTKAVILDHAGRQVMEIPSYQSQKREIRTTQLVPGLYLVHVSRDGAILSRKFVVRE